MYSLIGIFSRPGATEQQMIAAALRLGGFLHRYICIMQSVGWPTPSIGTGRLGRNCVNRLNVVNSFREWSQFSNERARIGRLSNQVTAKALEFGRRMLFSVV